MEYLCCMEIQLVYFTISDKEIISVLTLAKRVIVWCTFMQAFSYFIVIGSAVTIQWVETKP